MSNPRAYLTLKNAAQFRVEFNGVTTYQSELPASDDEIEFRLNGKIPRETGEAKLFVDDKLMGLWNFTYPDPKVLLDAAQKRYDRGFAHFNANRNALSFRFFGEVIAALEDCCDSGRNTQYETLLTKAHRYRAYAAARIAYLTEDDKWRRLALICEEQAVSVEESFIRIEFNEASCFAQFKHILHLHNFAVELSVCGDFVRCIEQATKALEWHKRLAQCDEDSRMELRLMAVIASAQTSLGDRDTAMATIQEALTLFNPAESNDSLKLGDFADLCKQKENLIQERSKEQAASVDSQTSLGL